MSFPHGTPKWAEPLITDWLTGVAHCPHCNRAMMARYFKPYNTPYCHRCTRCNKIHGQLVLPKFMPPNVKQWVDEFCKERDEAEKEDASPTPP